jgi:hypothetical protein
MTDHTLMGTRIVQDIELKMDFDEFIKLSAHMGATRLISRKGCWFMMTKEEMYEHKFMEEEIGLTYDLYFFWYKWLGDEDNDDVESVEF